MTRTAMTTLSCPCASLLLLFAIGCSTAPDTAEGKSDLESRAAAALSQAESTDPSLAGLLAGTVGYAVFPSVGKGGLIAGGAYGKGVLYENGKVTGYCDLTQGTLGLQAGGQSYTEILAFATRDALSELSKTIDHRIAATEKFQAKITGALVLVGAIGIANLVKVWAK